MISTLRSKTTRCSAGPWTEPASLSRASQSARRATQRLSCSPSSSRRRVPRLLPSSPSCSASGQCYLARSDDRRDSVASSSRSHHPARRHPNRVSAPSPIPSPSSLKDHFADGDQSLRHWQQQGQIIRHSVPTSQRKPAHRPWTSESVREMVRGVQRKIAYLSAQTEHGVKFAMDSASVNRKSAS